MANSGSSAMKQAEDPVRDAAPEMLETLRVTASNIRSLGPAGALAGVYTPYQKWLAEVEAAIAKAEGR